MKDKINKWVMIREGEVRNVFDNRKKAVKHLQQLLKQTLKDFENQDKSDGYTYSIVIPMTIFKPIEERSARLSLL